MKAQNTRLNTPSATEYTDNKRWKWTRGKIFAFIGFGLLVLSLIVYELVSSEPYSEDGDEEYVDIEGLDNNGSIADITDYDNNGPQEVNSTVIAGDTPSTEANPSPNESSPANTVVTTPRQTSRSTTETQTNAASTTPQQLRVSDDGEIVEVTNSNANASTTSNDPSESGTADNENIEEAFYTPVTVTGSITSNSDGTALNGVRISVKGTPITTITDAQGKYAIAVPGNPENRTLQFSYRGNVSERLVSPNTRVINIKF